MPGPLTQRLDPAVDLVACLFGGQAFTWWREEGSIAGVVWATFVRIEARSGAWRTDPPRPSSWLEAYLGSGRTLPKALLDDDVLGPLARQLPGLRLLRQDPWGATASFMLSPVNNVPRIQENIARLSRLHGQPVGDAFAFPSVEQVAALGRNELAKLGLGFRGPRLVALAQAIEQGELDLGELAHATIDDARDALVAHDGIGPKVAECILCYALGFDDAFPADRWVNRATEALLGRAMTPDEARGRWGERAAMAQQLLFHGGRTGLIDGLDASPVARFANWRPMAPARP